MKSRRQTRFEKAVCSESANLIMDRIAEIAFKEANDPKKPAALRFVRFFKGVISTFRNDYLTAETEEAKEKAASEIEDSLDVCRAAAERCGIKFELDFELGTVEETTEFKAFKAILFGEESEAAQNKALKLLADHQSKEAAEEFLRNLEEARLSLRYNYLGAESKKEEIGAVEELNHLLNKCCEAAKVCGIKFEYDFFCHAEC